MENSQLITIAAIAGVGLYLLSNSNNGVPAGAGQAGGSPYGGSGSSAYGGSGQVINNPVIAAQLALARSRLQVQQQQAALDARQNSQLYSLGASAAGRLINAFTGGGGGGGSPGYGAGIGSGGYGTGAATYYDMPGSGSPIGV